MFARRVCTEFPPVKTQSSSPPNGFTLGPGTAMVMYWRPSRLPLRKVHSVPSPRTESHLRRTFSTAICKFLASSASICPSLRICAVRLLISVTAVSERR